jgi:DNA-binding NarL/FixJ family response regulator
MKSIQMAIVEDQEDIRNGLKSIIDNTEGFECVDVFQDAESALESLQRRPVDIVIMDIHLPMMSGIECVKKLKSVHSDMQFLMFSIFENNESIFEALKAGASGYIIKKTPPHKVLDAVKELYEGGSPMSSVIARKLITHFQRPINSASSVLTPREAEILDHLSTGLLYKEIANKFGTSVGTVRQQIHKIYEKLHVQNRTEAINKVYGS